jgi:RNA polymerase sigma-70 factor (ECF subfamily)
VNRRSRQRTAVASPIEDAEVVDKLRAGDEEAFRVLVQTHHASMLRVARLYVRSPASAEEVVQETWLAALRGIDRFEGRASLKTWLFRILVNIARTRAVRDARSLTFSEVARSEASRNEMAVDPSSFQGPDGAQPGHWGANAPEPWQTSPDRGLLGEELLSHLREALAKLPESQRLVITLRDVEGWTSREVCNALEISETNQRVLLHRARSRARCALNEYFRGSQS